MSDSIPVSLDDFKELHPADIADRLQRLPEDEAVEIITQLPPALAARALDEMEDEPAIEMLKRLSSEKIGALFAELPHGGVADLAARLPPVKRREVLNVTPPNVAAAVRALLHYGEDTAGGIMSDRFIALHADMTVQQSQELLRSRRDEPLDDVTYLYVTDETKKLVGIISLRDLVFRRPERRIDEIMNRDVKSVRVESDQEELARQFEHYHYLGLPVVERNLGQGAAPGRVEGASIGVGAFARPGCAAAIRGGLWSQRNRPALTLARDGAESRGFALWRRGSGRRESPMKREKAERSTRGMNSVSTTLSREQSCQSWTT